MEILVLDDEYLYRLHIGDVIKQTGATVQCGLNGRYLEKNWRKVQRCTAIIVDTKMPFMDGLSVIRYLNKKGWTKPVLLIHEQEIGPRGISLETFCEQYRFATFGLKNDVTIRTFIQKFAVHS